MRALFLDRDGVVNVDHGYVASKDRFEFLPGIFDLTRTAVEQGFATFIVTNQAGIARGLYTEQDFARLMEWVCAEFERAGGPIVKVYHCPHHPDFGPEGLRVRCECRKPRPGLLLAAAEEFGLDMSASIMVGDKESDMLAGDAAGVGALVLLGGARADSRWINASSFSEIAALVRAKASAA